MADDRTDPQQLAAQLQLLQRELGRLDRRLSALESTMMDVTRAAAAVQYLAEMDGPASLYVDVGGGVQAAVQVDPKAPLLMSLGAGYHTAKAPADVHAELTKRSQTIQEEFQRVSAEAQRVSQAASALNEHISSLPADMV